MNQFKELKKSFLKWMIVPQQSLEESFVYNLLKEKYQNLPPFKQKIFKYTFFILLLGAVLFIPLSYFFSSLAYEKEFKEKKSLTLKLLRLHTNPTPPFPQTSQLEMRKRIQDIITKYQKQNYTINNQHIPKERKTKLKQVSFNVQVNYLNIKHAIELGIKLKQLPFVKMHSLKLEETAKYKNYYDVTYVISFFYLPSSPSSSTGFISKPKDRDKDKRRDKSKDRDKRKDRDRDKRKDKNKDKNSPVKTKRIRPIGDR